MDQNFDLQFSTDEEVEQILNAFLNGVQDSIVEDEEKTTILNSMKLAQIKFVYSIMKYITKGTSANVIYKLNLPFKTMGSVSVEADVLNFSKPEWFARAAEFASNTEIYPLEKNRIRLTFTFHGLTAPIE